MSGWAPKGYVHVDPIGDSGVRRMDCQNEIRIDAAFSLARSAAGMPLAGAAGNWRTDRKVCSQFQSRRD